MTLLLILSTCTQATPNNASHIFICYLALASRSFIPYDFFFTPIFQPPSHRHYLNFKVFFLYDISFHFLEEISQEAPEGWGQKEKGEKFRTPGTNATVLCISEVTGQTKKFEVYDMFNSSFCSSQSSGVREPRQPGHVLMPTDP